MNKILVITGGSRGIGEKTISLFMEKGWRAINLSRSACHLPHVKNISIDLSDINSFSRHADALHADLKNAEMISLVHNAGFYERDSIGSLSIDRLERSLTVNVVAAAALNEMIIPDMRSGSSILYIGTTLSEKAVPNAASYVISKHAVVGLMRSTAQDLMDRGIRSACICPGLVDTEMLKDTMDEATKRYLLENKVMAKRLIDPTEIADVIYFCATRPVINGITIHANLGHVAD